MPSAPLIKPDLYTLGGTVPPGDRLYVLRRAADEQLLAACRAGEFAYLLSPMQSGKSSVMSRVARLMAAEGAWVALIDLTVLGTNVTPEEWHLGLLVSIADELGLSVNVFKWWKAEQGLSHLTRLIRFFHNQLLDQLPGRTFIFVDEVNVARGLPFANDFFAAIRHVHANRATRSDGRSLTFILAGIATPAEFIGLGGTNPFQGGRPIELADFTLDEAMPLTKGWAAPTEVGRQLLNRVLEWTGGHPYLTQRVCREIAEAGARVVEWDGADVGGVVRRTFFGDKSEKDANLQLVQSRLIDPPPDAGDVFAAYAAIRKERGGLPENKGPAHRYLKLSGIVSATRQGKLKLRNRIYKQVFDLRWLKRNRPVPAAVQAPESRGVTVATPDSPPRPSRSLTWLHVSDLHFADGEAYDRHVVLRALVEAVRTRAARDWRPDLVFVTGDLAFSGRRSQYEQAQAFLDKLIEAAGVPKERVFVIPGNHDIDRAAAKGLSRTLNDEQESMDYFGDANPQYASAKLKEFYDWHDRYFAGVRKAEPRTTCQPPAVVDVRGAKVGVLAINSALFCLGDDDKEKLWVGRKCIDAALERLRAAAVDVSVALVHHPIDWLHPEERINIKGALRGGVDVMLRGHLHEAEVEAVSSPQGGLLEMAAGACYQTRKYPNRAFLVRAYVDAGLLRVMPLRYEDKPKEVWTVDTSVFPDDEDNGYQGTMSVNWKSAAGAPARK